MDQVPQTKKCSKCQTVKLVNEFYKDKRHKDGLQSHCKICIQKSNKQWFKKNPEKFKIIQKRWRINNPENIQKRHKKHHQNHPDYYRNYMTNRRLIDSNFKRLGNLRSYIKTSLKNAQTHKSVHSIEYLGQTLQENKLYLEKQFYGNMTHENYGRVWHIDHIVPLSFFNLLDPTEQRQAFHYTNTRPLLIKDNLEKHDKVLKLNFNDLTPFI